MKVITHSTKNGLKVLTVPLPNLESATVTVWVGTGSRSETEKISGISHFLEHMAFKGGKRYKNAWEVSNAIDAIGGEFNASTSKEYTNFYVRAANTHVEKIFDVLSDMVLVPNLLEEDIEREKGVIVEEMNMYEDTPMYKIGDIFENLFFGKNSLARDIIGTKETVNSLTRADFVSYRDRYYQASNMIITVSGGVHEKQVMSLAEKYFGSLKGSVESELDIFDSSELTASVLLKNKKVDQVHMILGYPGIALTHNDRYVESVAETILGGGMSSRLFTEVREKRGLAYSVSADSANFIDTGYIGAHAGLDQARIDEALKVIINEFEKMKNKSDIKDEEVTKAKEYLRGHIALAMESTKAINGFIGRDAVLTGRVRTLEELFAGIDAVTKEDIVRYANTHFIQEKLRLAIIGPFKDQKRFEKLTK